MNNWIDLSKIPMRNFGDKQVYDWKKSKGISCNFKYNDIIGILDIVDYNTKTNKLSVSYNNNINQIGTDSFKAAKIARIIGIRTNDFKVEIGTSFVDNNRNITVVSRQYREDKNGRLWKEYNYHCNICGWNDGWMDEGHILHGIGCPCCSGRTVVRGINDINSVNKELSSLLLNYDDGYYYTQYSSEKLDFKCPICGAIHRGKTISSIAKRGLSCPCSKCSSYPNRIMFWLLTENNIVFYNEKTFDWSDNRKYDFYIPDFNMIIEMNGIQHYKDCRHFTKHSLEYEQENDLYKKEMAINNGIKNYIIINASKSDFDFIKENIINSNLSLYIDMESLDWLNIAKKSNENILKKISSLWNFGINDTSILSNMVGLSQAEISHRLHQCEEYNLIEKYDKTLTMKNGREKVTATQYQKYSKPIICNQNNMCFGNVSICEKTMSKLFSTTFYRSSVVKVIDGRYKQHKGFTFSYITKEQFNKNKEKSPNLCYGDFFNLKEEK